MHLKLRPDAADDTWRRSGRYVGMQLAARRHEEGDERGMHGILDKDAHDSGQGCTGFRTTIAFCRFFLYLCTVLEERLHCHSSRTANDKLTTKKERKKK